MGQVEKREPCPQCRENGKDKSGNNLVIYSDGGAHCFSCGLHRFGDGDGSVPVQYRAEKVNLDWSPILGETVALPHRKIPEAICRLYNYQTGEVKGKSVEIANYYRDGKLVGQKLRTKDKRFFSNGTMKDAPLFGQQLWRVGGRRIIVTEGEIDCLAIATLLNGKWPVVSIPHGAGDAPEIFKQNLEFLNSYEEVVICFDMDEPGRKASTECAKLLMPGKAKIVTLQHKDAADMLLNNKTAALSTALWEAKTYRPDGIIHVKEVLERPDKDTKIWPFPWEGANRMLYGQHSGSITMYTSGTGMGKSTFIRELAYDHLSKGRKVGMVMLEENPEETLHDMMALYTNMPIRQILAARKLNEALTKQGLEPIEFGVPDVLTDEIYKQAKEKLAELGLYLYDHHGENLSDNLIPKLEYLAVALGVDVIVLDHISVVVAAMESGNERQDIDILMKDLRSLVGRTGVHLDCVTQLRKADGKGYEEGGRITLQDLRGSGSLSSVPNSVLAIERNQQHADPLVANTMLVRSLKDRFSGNTGICMALRYEKSQGRLKQVDYYIDEDGEPCFHPPDSEFKIEQGAFDAEELDPATAR